MKKILFLVSLLLNFALQAQIISSNRWTDLFSYNNILTIKDTGGKLMTATENGIFYYTPSTGEISKLSKTNGLHEVKITAFDYNPTTQTGLVGYKNGSMDVITPSGITLIVDIPIATGFSGNKKINHISISGDRAVISTAYGVSIFNLSRKEFEDTCFFVNGSVYTTAEESIIKDNKIFTVTASGLYTHEINTTFPVFSTWTNLQSGNFKQIATNGNEIVFSDTTQSYKGNGVTFSNFVNFSNIISDIVISDSGVLFSVNDTVYLYNLSGAQTKIQNFNEPINTASFTGNQLYAGSKFSGILDEQEHSIKPDGPYSNISYKIDLYGNQIVICGGGRDSYNSTIYNRVGYYHFDGTHWNYPDMFKTNLGLNVLDAVVNRNNPAEIFFVNATGTTTDPSRGIYKMTNNQLVKQYAENDNSRIAGLAFDENKQLIASAFALPIGGGGLGIGYYYYDGAADKFVLNPVVIAGGAQKPFTNDGVLYIPAPFYTGGGMLMYNYNNTLANTSDDSYKLLNKDNNFPADGTVSGAMDKNGTLWIGTRAGLRILSDAKAAITEPKPQSEPIIIEQNGLGEELFRNGTILQIAVDSGNQKWVSVEGGGVFYLNSNGEQTINHFTKVNSPLPNDVVTDIQIDNTTGKIYFATFDGVVVYQGDVVNASSNFGDVLVYPNPVVYANYKGNVIIRGLAQKTFIRITDAAGNLVHSATANGGFYEWNLNNPRGVRVASGIYFVLMSNEDGTDTATAKIAVVN